MKKHKKGFTLIEVVVTIALIAILAVTLAPRLRDVFSKSNVSIVKHELSNIRTKLSIDEVESIEYPNLVDASDSGDATVLYEFQIEDTPSFVDSDGVSHEATSKVVALRDNTGGWFYIEELGEMYANLPNGAYTADTEREIWDGEIATIIDDGESDWDQDKSNSIESENVYLGNNNSDNLFNSIYEEPYGSGNYVLQNTPGVGSLGIAGAELTGNYNIYVDGKKVISDKGVVNNSGQSAYTNGITLPLESKNVQNITVSFEYKDANGNIKTIYRSLSRS